ncbi:MAG TPA: hypothetical protein V6D14_08550 [Coleofasciculaceae cyanobacterium]
MPSANKLSGSTLALRKHLDGVSHHCKSTMFHYHSGSNITINYYATLTTLMDSLNSSFLPVSTRRLGHIWLV